MGGTLEEQGAARQGAPVRRKPLLRAGAVRPKSLLAQRVQLQLLARHLRLQPPKLAAQRGPRPEQAVLEVLNARLRSGRSGRRGELHDQAPQRMTPLTTSEIVILACLEQLLQNARDLRHDAAASVRSRL